MQEQCTALCVLSVPVPKQHPAAKRQLDLPRLIFVPVIPILWRGQNMKIIPAVRYPLLTILAALLFALFALAAPPSSAQTIPASNVGAGFSPSHPEIAASQTQVPARITQAIDE